MAPDGSPEPKAVVSVVALGTKGDYRNDFLFGVFNDWLPTELAAHMAAPTDEKGIATLSAWPPKEGLMVSVSSPRYGYQTFPSVPRGRPEYMEIQLRPVGHLRGRVVADGKMPVGGLAVRVELYSKRDGITRYMWGRDFSRSELSDNDASEMFSVITVKADLEGRFDIPAAIYGWVDFTIPELTNRPYQLPRRNRQRLKEFSTRNTTEFVLKLEPAVHVHGMLRLFNTKMSPSDFDVVCELGCHPMDMFAFAVAPDGRFDCYIQPGLAEFTPCPCDETMKCARKDHFIVPLHVKDYERPAIEVVELRGRVVDEAGKPIGGAGFHGFPTAAKDEYYYSYWFLYQIELNHCDQAGRFRFVMSSGRGILTKDVFHSEDPSYAQDGPLDLWEELMFKFVSEVDGYEKRECEWKPKSFPGGIVPDIVLHRKKGESEKSAENR